MYVLCTWCVCMYVCTVQYRCYTLEYFLKGNTGRTGSVSISVYYCCCCCVVRGAPPSFFFFFLPTRILAIETGGCPHAAIREDISANLGACEALTARHQAEIVLVESGGGTYVFFFFLLSRSRRFFFVVRTVFCIFSQRPFLFLRTLWFAGNVFLFF